MYLFKIAVVFACIFAGVVSTQDIPAFSDCSLSCLNSVVSTVCNLTDTPCICSDEPLLNKISECALSSCSIRDSLTTRQVICSLCEIPMRDISPAMHAITLGFGVVALVMTFARIATRLFIIAPSVLGWDDYWVLVAVVTVFPCTACVFLMTKHGIGKDIWGVPIDDLDTALLWDYVGQICYMIILATTKLSLLCLYLRLFPTPSTCRFTYILLAITVAFMVAFTTSVIFQCTPISGAWQVWDGERDAKCINRNAMVKAHAAINIALDLAVIMLPLPDLYKLNLSLRKKIQVMVVFCLGFFITVVTIVRMKSVVRYAETDNITYDNGAAVYWSIIELYVSILCVSLPALAPLLKLISTCVFRSTTLTHSRPSLGTDRDRSGYETTGIKVQFEVSSTVGPYSSSYSRNNSEELQLVDIDPKYGVMAVASSRKV